MEEVKSVVLASASPRRLHLLKEAGYDVEVDISGAEEIEDHSLTPGNLALENARFAGTLHMRKRHATIATAKLKTSGEAFMVQI